MAPIDASALRLRRAEDQEAWLCAGLSLARLQRPDEERLAESVPWLLAALAECAAASHGATVSSSCVVGVPRRARQRPAPSHSSATERSRSSRDMSG